MFESLSALKKRDGPEEFIDGDWRSLPETGPIDLALADGSLNMLDAAGRGNLIASLARLLPIGASFVVRVHLVGPLQFFTAKETLAHHRLHSQSVPFFSAIRTDLDMLWLDQRNGALDLVQAGKNLAMLHKEENLADEEWREIEPLWSSNALQIVYDGSDYDRNQKIERIAQQSGMPLRSARVLGKHSG